MGFYQKVEGTWEQVRTCQTHSCMPCNVQHLKWSVLASNLQVREKAKVGRAV